MKYIVLVPDGAADRPLAELNNKTPLEVAKIPNIDFIASRGLLGAVKTVPENLLPGSDIAILSILGYDPQKYYPGRGSLEAANLGISLSSKEVAFRCNLITITSETEDPNLWVLEDYSADHISTEEARLLVKAVDKVLGNDKISFYPGISYRHLMVAEDNIGDLSGIKCKPPHDVMGEPIGGNLPWGEKKELLRKLIFESRKVLEKHEVNIERVRKGKKPANMIWLWGPGQALEMPSFFDKYKLGGAIISAVDLVKGIGCYIGFEAVEVPGATGYFDTDYRAKAKYAFESLKSSDFVLVHVEAPDEAGHIGDVRVKIKTIEDFDKKTVGPLLEKLEGMGDFRLLVLPDHATPVEVRTHVRDPVPFVLYSSENVFHEARTFSESSAKEGSLYLEEGFKLMNHFILKGERLE